MPPPQATEALYSTLQRYQLLLVVGGRRLWSQMLPGNFDGSWQRIAPSLVALTSGAQLAAAQAASVYVPEVLGQQGIEDAPEARVRPSAFAGVASDGRSLSGLLEGAVVNAKRAMTRGMDGGDALANGQRWLETALRTAVTDAARDATAAEIVARPQTAWVRMVNPPCCSRCAVLAGRIYKWNDGFDRHPQCDCLHIPTTVANADSYLSNPAELARRGLITDLSQNQRKRLDDGADLNKVLNESRDRWRERMAADRAKQGPVDRLGRRRPSTWGGGDGKPLIPPGGTMQDLMAKLTADVERHRAVSAMKAAGIAT